MAATNLKPKTFAISYGFVGGPLHARKFKRLMRAAGYEHLLNPADTDIIIAHSAGCWLMPNDCQPRLIIYVGMPLARARPSRSLIEANKAALKHGRLKSTLLTKAKVTFYGIAQPRRNFRIARMVKTAELAAFPNVPVIFIANRHDPWPRSEKLEELTEANAWAFLNLPGTHDDIWENPGRYVEIIDHYAGLLG